METVTKKRILLSLIPMAIAITFFIATFSIAVPSPSDDSSTGLTYNSNVCKYVTRADGTREDVGCSSNIITQAGLNHIRGQLKGGYASTAFDFIGLCNATTPAGGAGSAGCGPAINSSTTLDGEWVAADVSGLGRAQGTSGDNAASTTLAIANWSVWNTFTSAYDGRLINKTGLFNRSAAGDALFAENTFALVTLQTNDQLTVNWTIWVE